MSNKTKSVRDFGLSFAGRIGWLILGLSLCLSGPTFLSAKAAKAESTVPASQISGSNRTGGAEVEALKQLAGQIENLEQQVKAFTSELLKFEEEFIYGPLTASRGRIVFRDRAAKAFELIEGKFLLDGREIKKLNEKELSQASRRGLVVMDTDTAAGEHQLTLQLVYRGRPKGLGKVFDYYKDYRFVVDSMQPFQVLPGQASNLEVAVVDLGFGRADWQKRLQVEASSSMLETNLQEVRDQIRPSEESQQK